MKKSLTMSKSRGIFIVLLAAGLLWAISLATWQTAPEGNPLGPSGVADLSEDPSSQASPITTSCVAIIAVSGLLTDMLGKVGRFVVLGLAGVATVGYTLTAVTALGRAGATGWPIFALVAGIIVFLTILVVLFSSASWTSSNRYARSAELPADEFDSTATWDALSRGDEIDDVAGEDAGENEGEAKS